MDYKRHLQSLACLIALFVFSPGLDATGGITVERVIDGDTLQLSDGSKVRLIGIDTPEASNNPKTRRDSKRTGQDIKTITTLGRRASAFTRSLVEGKEVRLEFDVQKRDKYGRLLAYVFFPMRPLTGREKAQIQDGDFMNDYRSVRVATKSFNDKNAQEVMLNAYLLEQGFAQVMTVPPNVKYQDQFLELQKKARSNQRELWETK